MQNSTDDPQPRSRCITAHSLNVIVLGVSFMLIFTAFQTTSMVQKTVLDSAQEENNGTTQGDGYVSLGIIYGVFSLCNWIAPVIVFYAGTKISMIIGGVTYLLYILSFLKPVYWTLYLGSVLIGFGAAVIWTAQGAFLTNNSNSLTMGRNSGIFWAIFQCSLLWGNMYTYITLRGVNIISNDTRIHLFAGLSGACGVGLLTLLLLRSKLQPPPLEEKEEEEEEVEEESQNEENVKTTFLKAFQLIRTKKMLLLVLPFTYTGIELTFFSGIYGTCIANNAFFGDSAKGYLGISGMVIGAGEILGGAVFGIFGKWTQRFGKDPFILLAYVVHMGAFFLIFLNLPFDSSLYPSELSTYITSNVGVALFCSFLLGLGDSIFNTQIFATLGTLYPNESAPAFALYKFVQSIFAAISFLYSTQLMLQWQLLLLVIFGTMASFSFFILEWHIYRQEFYL